MVNVLLVDDHPVTREGLALRINQETDLQVGGEAAGAVDALQLVRHFRFDLAIVDVSLTSDNGIDLVKDLSHLCPHLRALVLSMYDDSVYAERALRAGARGYVNKANASTTIIQAIRAVSRGEVYLSAEMTKVLLQRVAHGSCAVKGGPDALLSDRELETFKLIGRGKSTREIAQMMTLSPKTIETYRSRIKEKLEVRNLSALTREATQWVLEHG